MYLHPALAEAMAKERERELKRLGRRAGGHRASTAESRRNGTGLEPGDRIVIRLARPEDASSLSRLGQLDGDSARGERFASLAEGPEGVLVAEVGGSLVAALEQGTRKGLADPFRRSAPAMELLQLRSEQLRGHAASATGRLAALRGHLRARHAGRPNAAT